MFEDEDFVAHDDAHKRDEAKQGGQAQRLVGYGQTYHGSGNA